MNKKQNKKLSLGKKNITRLTSLNSIVGGTGTFVDTNTNPYNPGTPSPEEPKTTDPTITKPKGTAVGTIGKTTSKLC